MEKKTITTGTNANLYLVVKKLMSYVINPIWNRGIPTPVRFIAVSFKQQELFKGIMGIFLTFMFP